MKTVSLDEVVRAEAAAIATCFASGNTWQPQTAEDIAMLALEPGIDDIRLHQLIVAAGGSKLPNGLQVTGDREGTCLAE